MIRPNLSQRHSILAGKGCGLSNWGLEERSSLLSRLPQGMTLAGWLRVIMFESSIGVVARRRELSGIQMWIEQVTRQAGLVDRTRICIKPFPDGALFLSDAVEIFFASKKQIISCNRRRSAEPVIQNVSSQNLWTIFIGENESRSFQVGDVDAACGTDC